MAEIVVHADLLAEGLERGIGLVPRIFATLPLDSRLRQTPCGLVGPAIHYYARQQGVASKLTLSRPDLPIDPSMRHVFPMVGPVEDDPLVIDASYSQFFAYGGLTLARHYESGCVALPDEKVLVFPLSQRNLVAPWMAGIISRFHQRYGRPPNALHGQALEETLSRIWDPANFEPWRPPDYAQTEARLVCSMIPLGAIAVE